MPLCPKCDKEMRLLLTSYYCPDECDKKVVCEAKTRSRSFFIVGQRIMFTEFGAKEMDRYYPLDIKHHPDPWQCGDEGEVMRIDDTEYHAFEFVMFRTGSKIYAASLSKAEKLFYWKEGGN